MSENESRSVLFAKKQSSGPSFQWAIGTGIADRGKDFMDFVRCRVRRKPRRRIRSSDLNSVLSDMRIGPILHPTVLLAFTNGTASNRTEVPHPLDGPGRGSSFPDRQHPSRAFTRKRIHETVPRSLQTAPVWELPRPNRLAFTEHT
jgi:hypothetical protein